MLLKSGVPGDECPNDDMDKSAIGGATLDSTDVAIVPVAAVVCVVAKVVVKLVVVLVVVVVVAIVVKGWTGRSLV